MFGIGLLLLVCGAAVVLQKGIECSFSILQAAAHSVCSSHAFKRRQHPRYAVQDSARMETDNDWQHALGLTDNDTGSSAGEEDYADVAPKPVLATVGSQTDNAGLVALLAGTAGKDSLMTAARQEILRLKDVNSRLLRQAHSGELQTVMQ